MGNLADKPEKNPVTEEMEEKKWEVFESTEARLKNQKHLEMAYEWLRNRGKQMLLTGAIENL